MPIPTLVLDEIASGKILHYKQAYPPHHRIKLVDGDIVALAAAMKSEYCDLRSLDLSDNEITNEGLEFLLVAFTESVPRLERLNLSRNQLTPACAENLMALLKESVYLSELRLSGNVIGSEGMKCLASALPQRLGQVALYLSGCQIGDEGIDALCELIEENKLSGVKVDAKEFSATALDKLLAAFRQNPLPIFFISNIPQSDASLESRLGEKSPLILFSTAAKICSLRTRWPKKTGTVDILEGLDVRRAAAGTPDSDATSAVETTPVSMRGASRWRTPQKIEWAAPKFLEDMRASRAVPR
ncbi:MAG: hypothetical protein AABY34_02020 [Pseudomonadota bacterium]